MGVSVAQLSLLPPAPGSDEELVALYEGLPRVSCDWCGSEATPEGSCCPSSIACPQCYASPGSWCKRPSGHEAMDLHKARVTAAENVDRERLRRQAKLDAIYDGVERVVSDKRLR